MTSILHTNSTGHFYLLQQSLSSLSSFKAFKVINFLCELLSSTLLIYQTGFTGFIIKLAALAFACLLACLPSCLLAFLLTPPTEYICQLPDSFDSAKLMTGGFLCSTVINHEINDKTSFPLSFGLLLIKRFETCSLRHRRHKRALT